VTCGGGEPPADLIARVDCGIGEPRAGEADAGEARESDGPGVAL
jgi:hypothetical protein